MKEQELKLGKTEATNDVKFKLTDFADLSALPKPPRTFGYETEIKGWNMLSTLSSVNITSFPAILFHSIVSCAAPANTQSPYLSLPSIFQPLISVS